MDICQILNAKHFLNQTKVISNLAYPKHMAKHANLKNGRKAPFLLSHSSPTTHSKFCSSPDHHTIHCERQEKSLLRKKQSTSSNHLQLPEFTETLEILQNVFYFRSQRNNKCSCKNGLCRYIKCYIAKKLLLSF